MRTFSRVGIKFVAHDEKDHHQNEEQLRQHRRGSNQKSHQEAICTSIEDHLSDEITEERERDLSKKHLFFSLLLFFFNLKKNESNFRTLEPMKRKAIAKNIDQSAAKVGPSYVPLLLAATAIETMH